MVLLTTTIGTSTEKSGGMVTCEGKKKRGYKLKIFEFTSTSSEY